ncbi:nlaXM [Symbiodinium microadriaticum]|nr:nlaXM [Symbiodinium microadriaticum]
MAPIQRPDPVTGELRNVTLVTPPVSSGDRVVQPLTDYWRSAFSDKRQKLSSGGDSGYGEASVSSVAAVAVATPPPPTVPTDVYAEVHDQTMDATAPPPTVPTAIDPLEEQSLLAELETQIMSPAPSQREEGPMDDGGVGSGNDLTDDDNANHDSGLLSFDEMAQVKPVVACEITPFKQKFLQKHVLDCSSVVTFKGVCHMIKQTKPLCFILENVDSLESGTSSNDDDKEPSKSNLEMIMTWLNELGYGVTVEKLRSDDFGLPQRRSRLYFFGLRYNSDVLAEPADDILSKVGERLLLLHKKATDPECFMLPSDDNLLEEELRRLEDRLNKANTNAASASEKGEGMEPASAKGDKWRDIHSSMAEQSCCAHNPAADALMEHSAQKMAAGFSAPCITAAIISFLACMRFNTQSEDEELIAISERCPVTQ